MDVPTLSLGRICTFVQHYHKIRSKRVAHCTDRLTFTWRQSRLFHHLILCSWFDDSYSRRLRLGEESHERDTSGATLAPPVCCPAETTRRRDYPTLAPLSSFGRESFPNKHTYINKTSGNPENMSAWLLHDLSLFPGIGIRYSSTVASVQFKVGKTSSTCIG